MRNSPNCCNNLKFNFSVTVQTLAVPVQANNQPANQLPGLPFLIYELTGLWSDLQGAVVAGDTDAASYDLQQIMYVLQELSTKVNEPAARSYIANVEEEVSAALSKIKLGRTNMIDDIDGLKMSLGNGAKSVAKPGNGIILDYYNSGMNSGLNQFFNNFAGGELFGGTGAEGEEFNPIEPTGELPPPVGTIW